MAAARKARDVALLDALESLTPEAFEGDAWRIVRQGRDPLLGYSAGARWDPPNGFDVIYASLAPNGAMAEIFFHLNRAPVFPSRQIYRIHRIAVNTRRTLRLADLSALARLDMDIDRYGEVDYREVPTRTQEIGDAAYFLSFDGLIVPSARHDGANLVLFMDRIDDPASDLVVRESQTVDWSDWRRRQRDQPS